MSDGMVGMSRLLHADRVYTRKDLHEAMCGSMYHADDKAAVRQRVISHKIIS